MFHFPPQQIVQACSRAVRAVSSVSLDALGQSLHRHDRDRYLTTLFAPADRRDALVALYSFNFEIAKTREVVREPLLGRIRLQWWREAVDEIYCGRPVRHHEVAEPLATAIRRYDLTRYHFDRLIEAREADLEDGPPRNLASLERYAQDTSSRLIWLALESLGIRDAASVEAGRRVGIAWALIGLIRALPVHARTKRTTLPADLAAETGLDERDFFELRPSPALAAIVRRIADAAHAHLMVARAMRREVPRHTVPALLPARLAQAHLHRLATAAYDPFSPALAVPDGLASWRLALAAMTGRY
jgi:NADH dehydrogenase [ubiquinone] 1 alpha subcomplex assembly factor 6